MLKSQRKRVSESLIEWDWENDVAETRQISVWHWRSCQETPTAKTVSATKIAGATNSSQAAKKSRCSRSRHRISQYPYAFDFHLHHIAGLHGPRIARRAGVDRIARRERYVAADEANNGWHIEDQIGGALLLDQGTVQTRRQQQIGVVESGDDLRTQRREA